MNKLASVIAAIIGLGLLGLGVNPVRAGSLANQEPQDSSTIIPRVAPDFGASRRAVRRDAVEPASRVILDLSNLAKNELAQIQRLLTDNGFDAGPADGVWGARTKAAIARFQQSLGDAPTGTFNIGQLMRLSGDVALVKRLLPQPAASPSAGAAATIGLSGMSHVSSLIRASRLFAGPDDYPPRQFAAYGILAFKSEASTYDRARHLMICQAYVSSIRPFDQVGLPVSAQMATVWPVTTGAVAGELMGMPGQRVCARAVDEYGSITADRALRDAALAGAELGGHGPYLLAWSPAAAKGAPDAVVLVADLSDVQDYKDALDVMLGWVNDIERDPALWSRGWSVEGLRLTVQRWFDKRGSQLLTVVGGL